MSIPMPQDSLQRSLDECARRYEVQDAAIAERARELAPTVARIRQSFEACRDALAGHHCPITITEQDDLVTLELGHRPNFVGRMHVWVDEVDALITVTRERERPNHPGVVERDVASPRPPSEFATGPWCRELAAFLRWVFGD